MVKRFADGNSIVICLGHYAYGKRRTRSKKARRMKIRSKKARRVKIWSSRTRRTRSKNTRRTRSKNTRRTRTRRTRWSLPQEGLFPPTNAQIQTCLWECNRFPVEDKENYENGKTGNTVLHRNEKKGRHGFERFICAVEDKIGYNFRGD